MAAQWYFRRIRAVISDIALSMYASLPANRKALSRFVKSEEVMFVENLLSGLRDVSEWDSTAFDTDASFAKFKDYILECEERMERNLRSVAYNIDDENTLAIVAGLRRIEKVRMFGLTGQLRRADMFSGSPHVTISSHSYFSSCGEVCISANKRSRSRCTSVNSKS